jgi:hypothetical protein
MVEKGVKTGKAAKFRCPDDSGQVLAEYMILVDDTFYLVGTCPMCNTQFRFKVADVMNTILDGAAMPHAKGGN